MTHSQKIEVFAFGMVMMVGLPVLMVLAHALSFQ